MNPLSLIPPQYQLLARIVVIVLLAALCFGAGCKVTSWHDASAIADVRVEHANAIADATARGNAAQKKADAERDEKTAALAVIDQTHHDELRKSEHENASLRADVATGTRVVRVAATCTDPRGPAGVPQAAASGSVDPGAGATLDAAGGQAVLDLRTGAGRVDAQLPACQASLACLTGQGPCPAPASP